MSHRKRERRHAEQLALEHIRGRIVSGIHSGHLSSGDRLPSYREIAAQTGVDLRAVARIYAALAEEGMLEIRSKTGAYVACQEHIAGDVLAETARWAAGMLHDAWRRRIPIPAFNEFVRRCIASTEIRCACIESTEDQLVTLCTELSRDFGLLTTPVHADTLIAPGDSGQPHPPVPAAVRAAHMLATTTFHAGTLRTLAHAWGKPLTIVRLEPDFTARIEQQLQQGELAVICVDPGFVERVRIVFAGDCPERVRGVLADDERALARLDPTRAAIVTYAARRKLGSRALPPSIMPPGLSVISSESAADLIDQIVRLNLEALHSDPLPQPELRQSAAGPAVSEFARHGMSVAAIGVEFGQ